MKLRAIKSYTDKELNRIVEIGEELEVSSGRAIILLNNHVVEIMELDDVESDSNKDIQIAELTNMVKDKDVQITTLTLATDALNSKIDVMEKELTIYKMSDEELSAYAKKAKIDVSKVENRNELVNLLLSK